MEHRLSTSLSLFLSLVAVAAQNLPPGVPTGPVTPTFGGLDVPEDAADRIVVKFKGGGVGTEARSVGISVVPVRKGDTVENTLKTYREREDVEYAEPDRIATPDVLPNDPKWNVAWGLAKIGAPDAWSTVANVASTTVCVVDSGVNFNHPDLAPNMHPLRGLNAIKGGNDPFDDLGHGTHVAGIIGAVGNNSLGSTGVAWKVKILACKFMDAKGYGLSSDAVECIWYCMNNGAKIISASWSFTSYSQCIKDAIGAANSRGVLFVSSAGNKATNLEVSPAYPPNYGLANQIVVASSTFGDGLSGFSNYGRTVAHIAAPGENIMSTLFQNNDYGYMSGTSMATPIVSGAAALILGASGNTLPMGKLKGFLLNTAFKAPLLANKVLTGRLDLKAALKAYTDSLLTEACKAAPGSCVLKCDANMVCTWMQKTAAPAPSPPPEEALVPDTVDPTPPQKVGICKTQPASCVLQCGTNNMCSWVQKSSIPKAGTCKLKPATCTLQCEKNNVCSWAQKSTVKTKASLFYTSSWL